MDLHSLFNSTSSETPPDLQKFGVAIALTAICSWLLSIFYVKFGTSPSNRKIFAGQFVPLALSTTVVISIIQSSLALSLGLVGALSIVRFRAAIKEPEELVYLFICITLGLGFGAGQFPITAIGLVIMLGFLFLQSFGKPKTWRAGVVLSISSPKVAPDLTALITAHLNKYSDRVDLRRLSHGEVTEAIFVLQPSKNMNPDELLSGVSKILPQSKLSLLEQREIY